MGPTSVPGGNVTVCTLLSVRLNEGHADNSEWTRDATHTDTGNHKQEIFFFNSLGLNTHNHDPLRCVPLVGWRSRRPGFTFVTLRHKGRHFRVIGFQLCDRLRNPVNLRDRACRLRG